MFILGFTDEDVVTAGQDGRLAMECGSAFEAEGLPAGFGIRQTAGEGRFVVQWYVQEEAAKVLDRHQVGWRRFVVGRSEG
jgi:hypothetical protein